MAFLAQIVTVTTTATLLNIGQSDGIGGVSYAIKVPTGGATVFVGGAGVTAATGWPLTAGDAPFCADMDEVPKSTSVAAPLGELLYGIVATGTQAVNVLVRGV